MLPESHSLSSKQPVLWRYVSAKWLFEHAICKITRPFAMTFTTRWQFYGVFLMTLTTPSMQQPTGPIARLNEFLDKYVLPYPVKYLTNRVVILLTLCLLIPLIFYTANQAFVNALN